MHGLIFFYLQKFADVAAAGSTSWKGVRSSVTTTASKFLPSGTYPDSDAVAILSSIADTTGRPLPSILEAFGQFLSDQLKGQGFRATTRQLVVEKFRNGLAIFEKRDRLEEELGAGADVGTSCPRCSVRDAPD